MSCQVEIFRRAATASAECGFHFGIEFGLNYEMINVDFMM